MKRQVFQTSHHDIVIKFSVVGLFLQCFREKRTVVSGTSTWTGKSILGHRRVEIQRVSEHTGRLEDLIKRCFGGMGCLPFKTIGYKP